MTKLCLGTYFKSIIRCKNKRITQKLIIGKTLQLVDPEFDDLDDSAISHIANGDKNPSNYLMDNVNKLKEDDYYDIVNGFRGVCSYLNPNNLDKLRWLLCYVIENDNTIKGDTIVNLVGTVKKDQLKMSVEPIEEFLAGIFLYVLKCTDNRDSKQFVKEVGEINFNKFKDNLSKEENNEFTNVGNVEETIITVDKEVSYEAKVFCLEHEDEMSLLPLCEIAFNVDYLHNDARKMYVDYKLCTSEVRREILKLKEIPHLDFSNKNWKTECINKYNKQIHNDGLTTKEFLYDGAKYFHRAFERYSNNKITNFDPYIFERPIKVENSILKDCPTSLEFYIADYYWYKENDSNYYVEPPMDYLWRICNLDYCSESEMTFWVCNFIISSSYHMVKEGNLTDEKWSNVSIDEELIRTQEDMYYYALLQLYRLYMVERNRI